MYVHLSLFYKDQSKIETGMVLKIFEKIPRFWSLFHETKIILVFTRQPRRLRRGPFGPAPSSRLRLALWASTQAGAPEPRKRILALFGTFWYFLANFFQPIFFAHFFPLTNCDKSLQ